MHYAQVHQEASTNEEEEKDRCVLCMYQHWYSHWYPINWSIPPVVLIMFQITGCFCGVCNRRYNGKGSWIGCDGECQNWYNFKCVGLLVTDEPPKGDWFCPKCSTTLD